MHAHGALPDLGRLSNQELHRLLGEIRAELLKGPTTNYGRRMLQGKAEIVKTEVEARRRHPPFVEPS